MTRKGKLRIGQQGNAGMRSNAALEELSGSVLWYEERFEPLAEDDWKVFDPNYDWDLPQSMRPPQDSK